MLGDILKKGAISAGKIGVLISASCADKQLDKIMAFVSSLMPGFIASNSMGKPLPEKYAASAEYAAVKNGKAGSAAELTIGVNDAGLRKYGIQPLSAEQKAAIESGAVETLFIFGDDTYDIDLSNVKNEKRFRIEL